VGPAAAPPDPPKITGRIEQVSRRVSQLLVVVGTLADVASIEAAPEVLPLISTLRGLACSATGNVTVSTPCS